MTPAARTRWDSITANLPDGFQATLYEVKPDGGFTFGLYSPNGRDWRTFAVNPDGGRAYALDY
jgi:hypothetical protein